MIKLLLIKVLFLIALTPLSAQKISCPPAADSTWADKRSPFKKYRNKTTFIFETGFKDTISVSIDSKLIVKRYMETEDGYTAVIGTITVTRPRIGKVVMKATNSTCAEFILRSGYSYAYISRDESGRWLVTYSNYERAYF